ncbi:hypothetical protein FHG87_005240 [Trinorchestia longiramus]|nr:hypothetical protein FHG87_005240 [Trinorchestia longiramus]
MEHTPEHGAHSRAWSTLQSMEHTPEHGAHSRAWSTLHSMEQSIKQPLSPSGLINADLNDGNNTVPVVWKTALQTHIVIRMARPHTWTLHLPALHLDTASASTTPGHCSCQHHTWTLQLPAPHLDTAAASTTPGHCSCQHHTWTLQLPAPHLDTAPAILNSNNRNSNSRNSNSSNSRNSLTHAHGPWHAQRFLL